MKQCTYKSQTAKLIELGFEKPNEISLTHFDSPDDFKSTNVIEIDEYGYAVVLENYSIGELIKMLPPRTHSVGFDWDLDINHDYKFERWLCFFNPENQIGVATELVDALYNLIIKLKEEGVI